MSWAIKDDQKFIDNNNLDSDNKNQEANYYALKSDLEGGCAKLINSFKNDMGLYPEELTNEIIRNLAIIKSFNNYPNNYLKWAEEKNKGINKENLIQKTKDNINSWAHNYEDNTVEVEAELKEFAKETKGLYELGDLKKLINFEIKKRKDKEKEKTKKDKKQYIEKKKAEFKESNFAFSAFNQFTNYLNIAEDFHKIQPFYYDPYRIWWLWNNVETKWEKVDDIDLMNAIDNHTQNPSTNGNIKSEIVESLKRVGRKHKPLEAKETWIQFKNVIYDIKTGQSFATTPEYFVTNPIPWQIGTSDKTPILDSILKSWVYKNGFQDETFVQTLKEIMVYVMLSYMPIHRIFCLIGEGLNGKGTFLRLIEKLIGKDNCCATEIEILCSNRFESNKLHKKLVCFIGEVDKGIFKKTKTIKSLTGEDTVRVEFKGKDGFDNKNYANPIIATNHLPETSDKTKGFYRRWSIVDFPNEFNEKKNILKDIPEEEYNNFCKQSLDILKNLIDNGEFKNDGTIAEREDKYEKHSNHITNFIKMYCNIDSESFIEFADFCEKYNEYLVSDGLPKKSKVEIGRALVLKKFTKKVRKITYGLSPTTKMCIENIKWRHEIEELE